MPSENVTHIKCKHSASLLHNNLCAGTDSLMYLHLNEAHILKQTELATHMTSTTSARANTSVVAYNEKEPVTQAKFCSFAFGECIVLVNTKGALFVYDKTGQAVIQTYGCEGASHTHLKGIASTPKHLFVGTGSGSVLVLSVEPNQINLVKELKGHKGPVCALTLMNKSTLVSGDETGGVKCWSVESYEEQGEHKGDGYPITSLSGSAEFLGAGNACGHIKVFKQSKTKILLFADIAAHTRSISAVHMHPTLPLIASSSEDTYISVYSLPAGGATAIKLVSQVSPNDALLTGLAWFGKNTLAVTAFDSRYMSVLSLNLP